MTFRMPLISRPAAKPDSLMARTFVSAGLSLLTALALPSGDVAHSAGMDVGRRPVRYVDKSWVKQTDLPLLTFVQQPNGKAAGLELPKILLRKGYKDKSWIETNDLPRQLATYPPYQPTDWPATRKIKLDVPDWIGPNIAVLNTVVVSTQPFGLYDWPLPHKRLLDLPDTTANLSLSLTAKPFLNTDWPLSLRPKAATPEPETLNVAAIRTVVAAAKPFAQLDWNLPKIFRDNRQARVTPLRDPALFDVTPVVTYNLAATDTPDTAFFSLAFWRPKPINPDIWTPIPVHGPSIGAILTQSSLEIDTEYGSPLLINSLITVELLTEAALDIDTESGEPLLATRDDPGGGNLLWTPKVPGGSIWRKV